MSNDDLIACVSDLLDEARTADRLLEVGQKAIDAVWLNAYLTLGPVTLKAIVERVITVGADVHPPLRLLKVDTGGIGMDDLQAHAGDWSAAELARALRYFLIEWLRIIGALTADILTPALHTALATLASDDSASHPGNGGE